MPPFPLWPDTPPLAIGSEPADVPTLSVFLPEEPTGAAVVVCPGGGYQHLADHEADPIARWLNTLGIAGIVLRYRHAPRYRHPAPLLDAARAVRTVRHRAEEWKLDRQRVGILGFSAGGHLAATLATHFSAGEAQDPDPVERQSSRPDAAILLYPVITLSGPHAHTGSRDNLLGRDAAPALIDSLSNERQVTAQTPPTFLFHTGDDAAVPVENALAFAGALRACRVPFELHVYETGPHGVGLAQNHPRLSSWPTRCGDWLAARGFARTTG